MTDFQYDRCFLGKDRYGSRHHALIQLTIGDLLFKSKLNSKQPAHQIQDLGVKKKKINKTSLGSVTGKGEWFYFFLVPSLCLYSYYLHSSQDFLVDNTHHLSNKVLSVFSQHCSYNIFWITFPLKKRNPKSHSKKKCIQQMLPEYGRWEVAQARSIPRHKCQSHQQPVWKKLLRIDKSCGSKPNKRARCSSRKSFLSHSLKLYYFLEGDTEQANVFKKRRHNGIPLRRLCLQNSLLLRQGEKLCEIKAIWKLTLCLAINIRFYSIVCK